MAELDLERLVKILRRTESSADGEALNAVRMANRMVKEAGKTWEDVLLRGSSNSTQASPRSYGRSDQSFRTPPSRRGTYGKAHRPTPRGPVEKVVSDDIDRYFDALASQRYDISSAMFVASVREEYEKNGYLTRPQFDVIERMFNEIGSKGGGRGFRF